MMASAIKGLSSLEPGWVHAFQHSLSVFSNAFLLFKTWCLSRPLESGMRAESFACYSLVFYLLQR